MADRCDCPYPDPMTYGGPNPHCSEHGDVDAILASGEYRDRKGRTWQPLGVGGVWWHSPSDRTLTPDQMRFKIIRERHRGECPGLSACEGHPVPHVARHDRRLWHAYPPHGVASNLYRTFGAALDAARHMTGETP